MSGDETNVALLDALRRANPVAVDDVAGRRELPSAHALFAEITAEPPRRLTRVTRVAAVVVSVALPLAAVLGAFAIVNRADDPNPAQPPQCFERADLGAPFVVTAGPGLAQACAQLWRSGRFAGPVPESFDRCLLASGTVAVFPGESGSVCGELGLRSVQPTSSAERVRKATDEAALAIEPPHCFDYEDARAIIQDSLDKYGLDDWKIVAGDHRISAKEPCASLASDAAAKTVTIQAIPNLSRPAG